jgi:hypothetical protein
LDLKVLRLSAGEGRHRVHSVAVITADGIVVALAGGDRPHVGAVGVSIPRRSLKDPSKISASSSVFTLVGHKDDEIARPISERLSKELNQVAVVAAGVHVDRATEEDIRRLVSNSMQLAEDLIKELKSTLERSNRL